MRSAKSVRPVVVAEVIDARDIFRKLASRFEMFNSSSDAAFCLEAASILEALSLRISSISEEDRALSNIINSS